MARSDRKKRLVEAARRARQQAVAPYSRLQVGAALLTRAGEIITGCNVESASFGLTCCAERVALFKALSEGKKDFVALAVVTRLPGGAMPCGACRQVLAEFVPAGAEQDMVVIVVGRRNNQVLHLGELLPHAFLPQHLHSEQGAGGSEQ